jgi:hypothetical protein
MTGKPGFPSSETRTKRVTRHSPRVRAGKSVSTVCRALRHGELFTVMERLLCYAGGLIPLARLQLPP